MCLCTCTSLDELPTDVLRQICAPLDAISLHNIASCGSRALRAIATDSCLWRPLLVTLHTELLGKDGIDPSSSLLPNSVWSHPRDERSLDIVLWPRLFFSCQREWRSHRSEALSLQRRRATLQVLQEYDAEIFGNGDGFEHAFREAVAGGTTMHVLLRVCAMSSSIQRLLWISVAAIGLLLAWAGACAVVGLHEVNSSLRVFASAYLPL